MPRPSPPWDNIFPWMAANAATAAQAAEHFGVAAATIRPAAKREAEKPGGGRLAGHPSYAVSRPPTPDAATAAAVYVPVVSLLPWDKNPRRNDAAAEKVADSIIRFGFGAPLLARKANSEIIAGHTRVKAARLLPGRWKDAVAKAQGDTPPGWHPDAVRLATDADPVLPVRYLDLSEGEAHALALADNRTAEASGWDEAMLAEVLRDFGTSGVSTIGMGWDEDALMGILNPPAGPNSTPDPGPPPVAPGPAHSAVGEVYELGPHRLACGDSRDRATWEALLGAEKLQMVWTDPPYGVAVNKVASVEEARRLHRRTDGKVVENDDLSTEDLEALLRASLGETAARSEHGAGWYVAAPPGPLHNVFGAVLIDLEVWRRSLQWLKDRFAFGRGDYHYRTEPIFYGWTPGAAHYFIDDHTQDNVLEFPRPASSPDHPTMKPVELVERCINNSSKPGWIVGDPFGGSGTTLMASARTGRVARLIELSPHYCDVIRRRYTAWARAAGMDPGTGALDADTDASEKPTPSPSTATSTTDASNVAAGASDA